MGLLETILSHAAIRTTRAAQLPAFRLQPLAIEPRHESPAAHLPTGHELKSCDTTVAINVSTWRGKGYGPGSWAPPPFHGDAPLTSLSYAMVSQLARAFSAAPLVLKDSNGNVVTEQEARDRTLAPEVQNLVRVLSRPQRGMSRGTWNTWMMSFASQTGAAYIRIVRRGSRLAELRLYSYGQLEPVTRESDQTDVIGYRATAQAGLSFGQILRPEDVIALHWPVVNPYNPATPIAPSDVIGTELETDQKTVRVARDLMETGGVPEVALTLPPDAVVDDDAIARMKLEFKERKRGELAVFTGGARYTRPGFDLQQMSYDTQHRIPESRVAAAYMVPPMVAGLYVALEHAHYSNVEQSKELFAEVIDSFWQNWGEQISDGLDEELMGMLSVQGYTISFDRTHVLALQEIMRQQRDEVRKDYHEGLLERDEARGAQGRNPLDHPSPSEETGAQLGDSSATVSSEPYPAATPPVHTVEPTTAAVTKREDLDALCP